jgi:hypothetical protein
MTLALCISPLGRPFVEDAAEDVAPAMADALAARIRAAFAVSAAAGLLHVATVELQATLPAGLALARDLASSYLTRLCQLPGLEGAAEIPPVGAPGRAELTFLAMQAPPMRGLEYLTAEVLAAWWTELDELVRGEIRVHAGGAQAYLRERNPLWRLVGRVTFHLAENKRDPEHPFAFLATYAHRLSAQTRGGVQHLPLSRALQEYAGAGNRQKLVALLTPIQRAAEASALVHDLVESRAIYQPLAWTPREAYRFLQDIPVLEASGMVVRVPDWWKAKSPPRPQVSVRIGQQQAAGLGAEALLDFHVALTLDGQPLTEAELRALLASEGGLVPLRGQWVEVNRAQLEEALRHWKQVEQHLQAEGLTFFEGMRLLAGVGPIHGATALATPEAKRWTGLVAGEWLTRTLQELTAPTSDEETPPGLLTQLRPYQRVGVHWLRFMTRLGLGACLADDMGLGKTIQVLGLLLHLCPMREPTAGKQREPSLLVVPASLIANWQAEIARFAPALRVWVAHPSESQNPPPPERGGGVQPGAQESVAAGLAGYDLIITTYGMLGRLQWLRSARWHLAILDEAQAIKNPGTRQTRSAKALQATARIILTGTPVENRLGDLWSLFDFVNPGLLGSAKAFADLAKQLAQREHNPYGPLRALIRPYILRRLKTDKQVIADLPEKTEVKAFCGLSRRQAALYEQSVRELGRDLETATGIQRRGIVLAYLMRFKQICNHPAQWLGDGVYTPDLSGKFQRLSELCDELAQRQEKALIFTQFREITGPLAEHLQKVFGRPGVILHGQTAIPKRRELVDAFQREDGPPFFVLSLKAGGTGLNLTAASQVIHFDRWWNPAVENQATDRAFRIGQKKNVLVHKFVCRGTIEERIDQMIEDKTHLARELLEGGAQRLLTEMGNEELLRFVALDIQRAVEA